MVKLPVEPRLQAGTSAGFTVSRERIVLFGAESGQTMQLGLRAASVV